MREMADNDVLFDAYKQKQSKEIMLAHGYAAESVGKTHHDVYMKPPVLNFELHTALFGSAHAEPLFKYYADTKSFLRKDEGNNYGYHFSDEDFYVYMTAHEWKHYDGSGTGIRSLLDCYVYCKVKGDLLDWDYIMLIKLYKKDDGMWIHGGTHENCDRIFIMNEIEMAMIKATK